MFVHENVHISTRDRFLIRIENIYADEKVRDNSLSPKKWTEKRVKYYEISFKILVAEKQTQPSKK